RRARGRPGDPGHRPVRHLPFRMAVRRVDHRRDRPRSADDAWFLRADAVRVRSEHRCGGADDHRRAGDDGGRHRSGGRWRAGAAAGRRAAWAGAGEPDRAGDRVRRSVPAVDRRAVRGGRDGQRSGDGRCRQRRKWNAGGVGAAD
ncbi:hypothetical protein LTR94_033730, partial [Friedmanniomyces endolithicus]